MDNTEVYYTLRDDNTIVTQDRTITLSRAKFLDYLATARVLGHNTGKI